MSSKRIAGEAIWSCGAKGLTKLVFGFCVFAHPVPEPKQEVCQGCHGTGLADADMIRAMRILRTAQLLQVKEEVKDPEDPGERLVPSISQDVSYVKGSHTHVVVELCCSGDSEMTQAGKKIGVFYIGVHARMQCTDVLQAVVKLLRVAFSSMTCKDKKKDCSVHVHVSVPCTGGSPLLNFCANQVREQHTADFKELTLMLVRSMIQR